MPTTPGIWHQLTRGRPTWWLLAIVLIALGCAPRYAYLEEPGDYGYDDDYGGYDYKEVEAGGGGYGSGSYEGDGYGGEAEYERMEVSADMAAPPPAPAKSRGKKLDKAERKSAATGSTGSTTPDANQAEAPMPEPDEPEPGTASGRQIIYTAGLGLAVFEVDATMDRLEAIPERHGGWIDQRDGDRLVLRVPAAELKTILAEIAEWGEVRYRTLEALDVTAEYTDLDSRIRVLEQIEAQLTALLAKAENVEQALEIQLELSRVRTELEALRAQMRLLASAIEFSTLVVQLYRIGVEAPPVGDDPFPWVDALGAEATAYR